ncbi:MAG: hypothetical protein ACI9P5_002477 [Saprospiraceae bacterium]|jgi:hypothetical protein
MYINTTISPKARLGQGIMMMCMYNYVVHCVVLFSIVV